MLQMEPNFERDDSRHTAAAQPVSAAGATYLPWLETVAPLRRPLPADEPGSPADAEMALTFAGKSSPAGVRLHQDNAASHDFASQDSASQDSANQEFAGLLHDVRNMVTAIELYCDLLEEPGVLTDPHRHYAGDLRLVSAASRRLLAKLGWAGSAKTAAFLPYSGSAAEPRSGPRLVHSGWAAPHPAAPHSAALHSAALHPDPQHPAPVRPGLSRPGRMLAFVACEPVESLADELRANQSLMSALTGPAVTLGVAIRGGDHPLEMSREDLTRVLVNLARNAAEAMPSGGHLQIELEETATTLSLSFSDTGRGIPPSALETVFAPGYTTHVSLSRNELNHDELDHDELNRHDLNRDEPEEDCQPQPWPAQHRGLGLAIVRSIVAAAGGSAWAANHRDGAGTVRGALFTLEFPRARAD